MKKNLLVELVLNSFLEDVEKEQEVIVKEEKAKILKAGVKKTGNVVKIKL
jgi:hypothetical protein